MKLLQYVGQYDLWGMGVKQQIRIKDELARYMESKIGRAEMGKIRKIKKHVTDAAYMTDGIW